MQYNRDHINQIKKQYPPGTRIELISMNDPQAVEPGTTGTVWKVDDIGTLHMKWDSGRSLAVVPGEDQFRVISCPEQKTALLDAAYSLEEIKRELGEGYRFHQAMTVEDVKQCLAAGDFPSDTDVLFVLEAGNLDIEVNLYVDEDKPPRLGYFCCVRANGEWESYNDILDEVNLDAPNFEAEMFRVLEKYAKSESLDFMAQNKSYLEAHGEAWPQMGGQSQ
ncbi:DUF4314 domain-containing protein [Ruminococcaceae bacterium OttesenSCG-928-D13]|nr:DUF4314 domain-containing protein [Ruminococcaceae bacterium OttesenSCG-928-D13]